MADSSLSSLFNPYAGVSAAMPEASVSPDRPPPDVLLHSLASMFTLPQRAIEGAAQYRPGSGEVSDATIGPILEAAMLPMRAGVSGVPMRAGEVAFGAGPIRYKQALAEGKITPAEYEGFMTALGEQSESAWPFPDKAAGRVAKNLADRNISSFWEKQQAWQNGGPAPTAAERAKVMDAFKRKTTAQQYLTTTQPIPEVDEILSAIMKESGDGR